MTRNGKSQLGGKINRALFNKARPDRITNKVRQPTTPMGGTMQARIAKQSGDADPFEK